MVELELYFYNECPFCQRVLSTIAKLGCGDKIRLKNIRENAKFFDELVTLCGNRTVPTLVVNGEPMRESAVINQFLTDQFLS